MARKIEATLWMLIKVRERSVMKRMVKKGRSYVPRIEGPSNRVHFICATRKTGGEFGKPWATTSRLPSRSRRHVNGH
jgi:hypothetical protein